MSAIAAVYHSEPEYDVSNQGSMLMAGLSSFPCHSSLAWNKGNIFLGCHQQWITPESVNESNPLHDASRRLVISADAIIDNRKELFQLLEVPNDRRSSMTDTELILLAYDKWGEACPTHLMGDFAFIIWDQREEKVFVSTDFSGTRMLYYYFDGTKLAICTLIEPLLQLPEVACRLNESWLAQYLAINLPIPVVDTSSTVYEHIHQLPASHTLSLKGNRLQIRRYSMLDSLEKVQFKHNEQYVEAFQHIFQEAVNARLRTYRGVGSQLSGGLDSGSVVAFAARSLRENSRELHTFSYVPADGFIDYTPKHSVANESSYIQQTVEHVGGIHSHYLNFNEQNSYREIDSNLALLEMPYKNYRNTFWIRGIFEKAAEHDIGVLLSGGRGNMTISWGYAKDNFSLLLKRLRWLKLMKEVKAYSLQMGTGRGRVMSIVLKSAFPILKRDANKAIRTPAVMIRPDFAQRTGVYEKMREHGFDENSLYVHSNNIWKFRQWHFNEPFHWNTSNTIGTKLSLVNGLQERDPTNDLRVIRFCLAVPENQYVLNGYDRALIRRATEGLLPDSIRLNQKVRGIQGVDWLYRMQKDWDMFLSEAEAVSKDTRLQEYIDHNVLNTALRQFQNSEVKPELAADDNLRVIMWSLILHRFMNRKF